MNISDLFLKTTMPIVWVDISTQIYHRGLSDVQLYVLQFGRKDPDSAESLAIRLIPELMWIRRLRFTTPLGLNVFD